MMVIIIIEEVVKEVNLARRSLWRLQKMLALNPAILDLSQPYQTIGHDHPRHCASFHCSIPQDFLKRFTASLQKLGQEDRLLFPWPNFVKHPQYERSG